MPTYTVDFLRRSGPPLVKTRFGVYQTPLVTLPVLLGSLPLLREINVRDFRYEIGWGKPESLGFAAVSGTAANPKMDFTVLDAIANGFVKQNVSPLWVLGYCPNPLKSRVEWASWKDTPRDVGGWQKVVTETVAHLSPASGNANGDMYEVWNEPDMPEPGDKMFFSGTPSDYGTLYAATAAAVRKAKGDALVGGAALAYDLRYFAPISDQPKDFASIHAYDNWASQIANLRNALVERTETPLFLTEYASFIDMPANGPQSRAVAAMRFFHDVRQMLSVPDLVNVYWAQWIDAGLQPGMGLLTGNGHKKALFNAFKIYGRLPVDRCPVTPTDGSDGVGVMASTGDARASVVLWNEYKTPRTVSVALQNLPVADGILQTFRIDAAHASFVDTAAAEELVAEETRPLDRGTRAVVWTGDLPGESVVYLEVRAADSNDWTTMANAPVPLPHIGSVGKADYWFADRTMDAPFADFDRRDNTVRLGMNAKDSGRAQIGFVLDRPVRRLNMRVEKHGFPAGAKQAAQFGMRLDFARTEGEDETNHAKSVVLPGDTIYAQGKPFVLDFDRLAPQDWDKKRVRLVFFLQDARRNAQVSFRLTPADTPTHEPKNQKKDNG